VDSLQKETSIELKKALDITSRTTTTTPTVRRFPQHAFKRPSLICTATFPRYTRIGHPTKY